MALNGINQLTVPPPLSSQSFTMISHQSTPNRLPMPLSNANRVNASSSIKRVQQDRSPANIPSIRSVQQTYMDIDQ